MRKPPVFLVTFPLQGSELLVTVFPSNLQVTLPSPNSQLLIWNLPFLRTEAQPTVSTDKYYGEEFKSVDSATDCRLPEALFLTSCVTLGKVLLSVPQFPHL